MLDHLERSADKLSQIRSLCQNWSRWVDEVLSAPQNEYTFSQPVNELTSSTDWAKNRVALIGDAARASGPISGQGCSIAMVDAYILAECLHHAPDNPEQALH